ncbi:hypothetical protein QJQ45_004950 [Haematococcus lacustris]|nr:hypothetical protein QJQ45_004950 [Haematococcus lacustris]
MATAWTTERPSFTWLWEDETFADATLAFRLADEAANAAQYTALPVHRAVLASNSEYFRARLLRWADSDPEDASSIEDSPAASRFRYTKAQLALMKKPTINEQGPTQLNQPGRHLTVKETFDSQAECDAARLVVCRVAERWAFPSLASKCLQQLVSLPPLQLPMQQLVQVLQTLPDSCALLPEHPQWQERVHTSTVKTYGDVHAIITSAQLRAQLQQLPFMAVQQWAGSNELTVDSENSVVELLSLWMAGPGGQACSKTNKQQLSCLVRVQHLSPAYVQGRLLDLRWFDIPGASTSVISAAACCGFGMSGVLNKPPPAWSAPPRKQLGSAELLQRTTIRWDVPQQQLADLLASKDLSARVASQPVYHAGCGWRLLLNLVKSDVEEGESSFTLGCWGELCTYAECEGHPLGARLLHGAPMKYAIIEDAGSGFKLAASLSRATGIWLKDARGYTSFLGKSISKAVDFVPFLVNGCLQITATFQVLHRPGQP